KRNDRARAWVSNHVQLANGPIGKAYRIRIERNDSTRVDSATADFPRPRPSPRVRSGRLGRAGITVHAMALPAVSYSVVGPNPSASIGARTAAGSPTTTICSASE